VSPVAACSGTAKIIIGGERTDLWPVVIEICVDPYDTLVIVTTRLQPHLLLLGDVMKPAKNVSSRGNVSSASNPGGRSLKGKPSSSVCSDSVREGRSHLSPGTGAEVRSAQLGPKDEGGRMSLGTEEDGRIQLEEEERRGLEPSGRGGDRDILPGQKKEEGHRPLRQSEARGLGMVERQ